MKDPISIFILFFGISFFLSQEKGIEHKLLKQANKNYELLDTNAEKAFKESKIIEEESKRYNAREAELRALVTQCIYYKRKNDFEKMMIFSKSLLGEAQKYNEPSYQAIAKKNLFEVYIFNSLYDKAFKELEDARAILDRENPRDSLGVLVKLDIYSSYANYYSSQKDYDNLLNYLRLFKNEIEKVLDKNEKLRLQYINNANLGKFYIDAGNLDSAVFYAQLSMSKDPGFNLTNIEFSNLSTLGVVALQRKEYQRAVDYFKKAENLTGYKNHLNIGILYENIIRSYKGLKDERNIRLYEHKRDSISLSVYQNQNKSLHKLLNETEDNNFRSMYFLGIIFLIILVIVILFLRKNKIIAKQEEQSETYLNTAKENLKGENYSKLVEMLKTNNPAFISYFNDTYPEFTFKLLNINPKISSSEIEFCALLKMKIATKDIARYRFIEPQTVRNKKYIIRKKLHIPKDSDIYQWFDSF
ncbi:MAG: hypothetical protein E2590_09960 [Chryseobacterium sp.]|nr:hypothetical protein [Chryseobacterium sp.]